MKKLDNTLAFIIQRAQKLARTWDPQQMQPRIDELGIISQSKTDYILEFCNYMHEHHEEEVASIGMVYKHWDAWEVQKG